MPDIDYLLIGHVSVDLVDDGFRPGGTVTYAGRTARALGCRAAVLTSAAAEFDFAMALPGVRVHNVPAPVSTTFTNTYTPAGRVQTIHGVAGLLRPGQLPADFSRPAIVHLGPVAREVDPDFVDAFPGALLGCTPQGWLRQWDADGRIHPGPWPAAERVLGAVDAVVLSREDVPDEAALQEMCHQSRLLVATDGRHGCTVYWGTQVRSFPAPAVEEIDPTGAGDIFAAVFLTELWRHDGNPWPAARVANQIAAATVSTAGLADKLAHIAAMYGSG